MKTKIKELWDKFKTQEKLFIVVVLIIATLVLISGCAAQKGFVVVASECGEGWAVGAMDEKGKIDYASPQELQQDEARMLWFKELFDRLPDDQRIGFDRRTACRGA